jgi:hypothetical protein
VIFERFPCVCGEEHITEAFVAFHKERHEREQNPIFCVAGHRHHFPELADFCNEVIARRDAVLKACAEVNAAADRFADAAIKLGRSLAGVDQEMTP